jgi:type II secretion system protein C
MALAVWLVVVLLERIATDRQTVPEPLPGDVEKPLSSSEPPPTEPPVPDGEPDEQLPSLTLVGTVVASDPGWSRASLSTSMRKADTRVYRIGDRLPDGSRLVAIRSDRVVLNLDGERRVLLIQERTIQLDEPDEEPPEKTDAPEPVVRTDGPGRYRVRREKLDGLLEKSGDLLRDTRVSLAFSPEGKVEGMRLSFHAEDTIFEDLGLKDGDVIHRIGSLVFNDPARMGEIRDLLENAKETDVEFTRDGEMVTLRYFID